MAAVAFNTQQSQPAVTKWYALSLVAVLFLLLSSPGLFSGFNVWVGTFVTLMIIFGLPVWIYAALSLQFTTFTVSDAAITINTGIIFKRSVSIAFAQVQNITTTRGPVTSIFGISRLNIWNASQSQTVIQNGTSVNKPAGSLLLSSAYAEELKTLITSRK